MSRKTTAALLILSILFGTATAYTGGDKRKIEEITGTVVAHDLWKWQITLATGSDECSIIVRVDEPDEARPRFIRVDFRLRGKIYPKEIVKSVKGKKRLRFKLIRTRDLDESLEEFIIYPADSHREERKDPIWELVPGWEGEKLPFGETLPSYVLVKGGIKMISEK